MATIETTLRQWTDLSVGDVYAFYRDDARDIWMKCSANSHILLVDRYSEFAVEDKTIEAVLHYDAIDVREYVRSLV